MSDALFRLEDDRIICNRCNAPAIAPAMECWSLATANDGDLTVDLYLTEAAAYEALLRIIYPEWESGSRSPSDRVAYLRLMGLLGKPEFEAALDAAVEEDFCETDWAIQKHEHPWVFGTIPESGKQEPVPEDLKIINDLADLRYMYEEPQINAIINRARKFLKKAVKP